MGTDSEKIQIITTNKVKSFYDAIIKPALNRGTAEL